VRLVTRLVAWLIVNYLSGYLGFSRGSSSITSPSPCDRVHRLAARLITDYFAYAASPSASACRVARHRLLRLRRASGCLGTSRGSSLGSSRVLVIYYLSGCFGLSRGSSSITSPRPCDLVHRLAARLVVDFFAYVARPGASACRAARRRLLRLRRASGCLGTSRGSSRGSSHRSSSTTLPTPPVRVPRHVARLVIDYFAYAARPGASARRAARHAARHRLL
jgi:hypothetical protein